VEYKYRLDGSRIKPMEKKMGTSTVKGTDLLKTAGEFSIVSEEERFFVYSGDYEEIVGTAKTLEGAVRKAHEYGEENIYEGDGPSTYKILALVAIVELEKEEEIIESKMRVEVKVAK